MARAAKAAGVALVTGDTKVVDRGHGDGIFITTTGVGVLADDVEIGPDRARPGDAVLVSGTIGDHGMAIMSVREGLDFESTIKSDTAPLNHMIATLLEAGVEVHTLRDPTRGGLAATLTEIAVASGVGVLIDERSVPIDRVVQSACEMLGMDPFHVANEGKLVAFVAAEDAERARAVMRGFEIGTRAAIIGEVVAGHPGMVVAKTAIGSTRVIDTQIGEQLPRIC
jgi:hydrogenase expression/formation protein HypE